MYKINELAKLAGITTRTLRYYDQLGILHPYKVNDNGYRIYSNTEVDKLQSILFYKELGYELKEVEKIVNNKNFDIMDSLNTHLNQLAERKERIDNLINLVIDTISYTERNEIMTDSKKFEAFKEKQLKDNYELFGQELKENYDSNCIEEANDKYKHKTKWEFDQHDKLTLELNKSIVDAFRSNDPTNYTSMKMCKLHKKWIMYYWPKYTKDKHFNLVKMYTEDERFKSYYDKIQIGSADFLLKAMEYFIEK